MVNLTLSDPGARVGGQHAAETETGGAGGGLEGDGSVGGAAGWTGCGKPGAGEALPHQPTQQTTGEGNGWFIGAGYRDHLLGAIQLYH